MPLHMISSYQTMTVPWRTSTISPATTRQIFSCICCHRYHHFCQGPQGIPCPGRQYHGEVERSSRTRPSPHLCWCCSSPSDCWCTWESHPASRPSYSCAKGRPIHPRVEAWGRPGLWTRVSSPSSPPTKAIRGRLEPSSLLTGFFVANLPRGTPGYQGGKCTHCKHDKCNRQELYRLARILPICPSRPNETHLKRSRVWF